MMVIMVDMSMVWAREIRPDGRLACTVVSLAMTWLIDMRFNSVSAWTKSTIRENLVHQSVNSVLTSNDFCACEDKS